jgi:hypothetical protein
MNKLTFLNLTPLLLAPLAALCSAAEPLRPAAQPSLSLPAKADLPDVREFQSKGYNVLFIAIDDLNDRVGCLGVPGLTQPDFKCEGVVHADNQPKNPS